jgi:hypothetical protein
MIQGGDGRRVETHVGIMREECDKGDEQLAPCVEADRVGRLSSQSWENNDETN